MKTLIEDYRRRIVSAKNMAKEIIPDNNMSKMAQIARLNTKAAEYRNFVAELEREYKPKLSAYNEVWVIQSYAGSSIDEVFIDQEAAEKEAKRIKDEFIAHHRQVFKDMSDEEWEKHVERNYKDLFKVVTLDDAIDSIKDEIRNERNPY